MRQLFERELQKVHADTLTLGSMVETGLMNAVEVLARRDYVGSKRIIEWDTWVNEKRFDIEAKVLALIARQQPVAKDMRGLAAILEISSELERIGDYAKGIAKINLKLDVNFPYEPFVEKMGEMSKLASQMIHESLQAFSWGDVELARKVPALDDTLDDLYNDMYREVITTIIQQPTLLDNGNNIIWAAHNLERAGDRAVNICERVIFTITGNMVELGVG
jgi:phosphate transport system protein